MDVLYINFYLFVSKAVREIIKLFTETLQVHYCEPLMVWVGCVLLEQWWMVSVSFYYFKCDKYL